MDASMISRVLWQRRTLRPVSTPGCRAALTAVGASAPAVHVSVVETIPASAAGKRPLVVALPGAAH